MKYLCDDCDHKFTMWFGLKKHIETLGQILNYLQDQCDIEFNERSSVQKYIESVFTAPIAAIMVYFSLV